VKIRIGGRDFEVTPAGDRVTVDGKEHVVSIAWNDGVPIVSVDGLPFRVELPQERGAEMTVVVDHRPVAVRVSGGAGAARAVRRTKAAASTRPPAPAGAGTVTATMTGEIVEVRVKAGERVAAGHVLAILEAMKMRNEVTAPVAGTVEAVRVTPGSRVSQDDVLVILKEDQG
jgi:glutaconyl-CoA decarboxylase